ncbi:uncharacterized protein FYW23_012084 [Sylvia borin]
MAFLVLLAPLLLLGTAAGQAEPGMDACLFLGNATEGNFSVGTEPDLYRANTTYVVTIKDDRNHSQSWGQLLLQALDGQNASVGSWEEAATGNCSSVDTAVLNISQSTARWTSPASNLSSVLIRVYLVLSDNSTELKTHTLNTGAESTVSPSITTPNSSHLYSPKVDTWFLQPLLDQL